MDNKELAKFLQDLIKLNEAKYKILTQMYNLELEYKTNTQEYQTLIEAYKILRIFCVSILITWNTITLSYPLLGGFGYTKEANRPIIIASAIHITGLTLLYKLSLLSVYSISYLCISKKICTFQYHYHSHPFLIKNQ